MRKKPKWIQLAYLKQYLREIDPRQKKPRTITSLPTMEQIDAERQRLRYRKRFGGALRSTIYVLVVVAAVSVLLSTLCFPVFKIYGNSMVPAVNEGEILVSVKGSSFQCGDVVVLNFNNRLLVKRVIAGPGQWVNIDKNGNVYVDRVLIDEPYLQEGEKALGDCTIKLPYQVPDGRYFVMGDNRSVSQDSRSAIVGSIEKSEIIGRAVFKVWPLSEFGQFKSN